ncbi:hypothetical protein [Actinoalloteichus spitiensis]|uniref:hypothetical protein n=1 Tax=Actinoalloteichus spitiensis TaxID=252394 RepID=UPI00037E519B|nr:hypothetical protein [Actinoalloteichus spitiensis]
MRGEDEAVRQARSLFSGWSEDEGPPVRTEATDVVLRGHRVLRRRRVWRIAGSAAGSALVLVGAFTLAADLGSVPEVVPGQGFPPSGVAPPSPVEPPPSDDRTGPVTLCPDPGTGLERETAPSEGEPAPPSAAPDPSASPSPPFPPDRPEALDDGCAGS